MRRHYMVNTSALVGAGRQLSPRTSVRISIGGCGPSLKTAAGKAGRMGIFIADWISAQKKNASPADRLRMRRRMGTTGKFDQKMNFRAPCQMRGSPAPVTWLNVEALELTLVCPGLLKFG